VEKNPKNFSTQKRETKLPEKEAYMSHMNVQVAGFSETHHPTGFHPPCH